MSLKRKIVLSFFISAFIIAILAAFEYLSFMEIKKELRYLELTDTISRKSLQLRRHEKNYFLYSPESMAEESAAVHVYLGELNVLLAKNPGIDRADNLSLRKSITEYEQRFTAIEEEARRLTGLFQRTRGACQKDEKKYFALVENAFLERPVQSAEFLETLFRLPRGHALTSGLRSLGEDINALRKTGEDILTISKDLDKLAREKAETVIRVSQIAILIFFPLFFIVGIGMLFYIITNVVRRLMLLINVVERTGKGSYPHLNISREKGRANDEVGVLIDKFNDMEDQLALHEAELEKKNQELMQTKKLAAIGTLAAGVAHELNNPLNNIYLSTQVLAREVGENCPPDMKEVFSDILSQTIRVKKIVGDLLEFARGREPHFQELELTSLVRGLFKRFQNEDGNIASTLSSDHPEVLVWADQGQLEQVFINLFTNAAEAMSGRGELNVNIFSAGEHVTIRIADSGPGIPGESLEKIFEPFFTTKDKGTGLGLAIVYSLIKKHQGEIVVASEKGAGATFTITLPKKGTADHGL